MHMEHAGPPFMRLPCGSPLVRMGLFRVPSDTFKLWTFQCIRSMLKSLSSDGIKTHYIDATVFCLKLIVVHIQFFLRFKMEVVLHHSEKVWTGILSSSNLSGSWWFYFTTAAWIRWQWHSLKKDAMEKCQLIIVEYEIIRNPILWNIQ